MAKSSCSERRLRSCDDNGGPSDRRTSGRAALTDEGVQFGVQIEKNPSAPRRPRAHGYWDQPSAIPHPSGWGAGGRRFKSCLPDRARGAADAALLSLRGGATTKWWGSFGSNFSGSHAPRRPTRARGSARAVGPQRCARRASRTRVGGASPPSARAGRCRARRVSAMPRVRCCAAGSVNAIWCRRPTGAYTCS
jgi:hypothetical protein